MQIHDMLRPYFSRPQMFTILGSILRSPKLLKNILCRQKLKICRLCATAKNAGKQEFLFNFSAEINSTNFLLSRIIFFHNLHKKTMLSPEGCGSGSGSGCLSSDSGSSLSSIDKSFTCCGSSSFGSGSADFSLITSESTAAGAAALLTGTVGSTDSST